MPTLEEYQEAEDSFQGYCLHCKEWTHESCESDARKYECPVCHKKTVYGAGEILMMGLVK